ncbi:thermonuclease family protein [Alicycliphilus denitrificans]|uniref:thermonuclease family protein n=1 Tax=Alicycliphilus denitrificans TaxID=179636 RepID=UPI003A80C3E6
MIAAAILCLVVGISDGDTLTARCPTQDAAHPYQQVKVRLAGIDAPERRQAYGERSRQHLAGLCFQQQAKLTVRTTDRYGRSVADVECRGKDAGTVMVGAGMAWFFVRYGKSHRHLAAVESDARAQRVGLWADREPVAPWDFRRKR